MQDGGQNAYLRACAQIGQSRSGLAEARNALVRLRPGLNEAHLRGQINQQLWVCERALGEFQGFFGQSGQDAWLESNVFKGKRGGTFVEIGGFDGVTGSNCLYFEVFRGWSGLLIEPSPALHAKAAESRRCPCLCVAVADKDGEAVFLDVREGLTQMGGLRETLTPGALGAITSNPKTTSVEIKVPTRTLGGIVEENGLTQIDYISLDVEGGELNVLAGFPFDRVAVTAWTIENSRDAKEINDLMTAKGYRLAEVLGDDLVYLR